jgi:hypothetical protein
MSEATAIARVEDYKPPPDRLSLSAWFARDIPAPDFLLGEILSTTSRMEIIGATGIGKSNFLIALGMAVADGGDFLHWRGYGEPRRVLFVDGEMSRRLLKRRLEDGVRRRGITSATFLALSREDFPAMEPLNTEGGQRFFDGVIRDAEGIDLVIFDNIQALLSGDMKDEEPWQNTLPWVRDLTRRSIGQIWAHHTGHDTSHGYGTKTREWQLDTVGLMGEAQRPDADIAFELKFTKSRERTPDNRSDFDAAVITLANDEWVSEKGIAPLRRGTAKDRVLELLVDAIARHGQIPPSSQNIPPDTPCIEEDLWRRTCEAGCISEGSADATRMAFSRAAKALVRSGQVRKWQQWVWAVRT